MRAFITLFQIAIGIVLCFQANAQILEPVKWSFSSKNVGGDEYELTYTAKIDNGWYVYSQDIAEDGPIPTSFNYDEGSHFQTVGKAAEKSDHKKEMNDPLFDNMRIIKFAKKVDFVQKVKVSDISKPISGWLEFMTCDDEKCLPPTEVDFSFNLKSKTAEAATQKEEIKEEEKVVEQPIKEASSNEEETAEKSDKESQIFDPVKWTSKVEKIVDGEFDLSFTAKVQDGWYVYSQNIAEDGPVPTTLYWDENANISIDGKASEESDYTVSGFDKIFEMEVTKYKKAVTFRQKIKATDLSKPLAGAVEFMTCDNKRCLPPQEILFKVDLANLSAEIGEDVVIGEPPVVDNGGTKVPKNGNVIDQEIPTIQATYVKPIGDCGVEENAKGQGLLMTFVFGFLGGLLALLTPCVFPMIPLTVSYFTKGSKDKASGIKNAVIYGLSIIVIYVAIGLFITGIFGETALNELSTNAIANVLFFLIFIAFAFSFFGYYEITLPSSWANKSDAMADKGGLIGTFFMAFTLALVSFSCTGPIIGTALVESAKNVGGPLIVMVGFSTALALPFGFFAAFPGWLNSLPRSGGWMSSVKVVLGFLELALALKFLSVADMTMGWNILPYELFMGAWVLIFAATTAYLLGFIRFPHDSPTVKYGPTRLAFIAFFAGLTIYLATGFQFNEKTQAYDSLALMSGLAPPAHYNMFLPEPQPNAEIKAKYPSFTKCANNLDCFKDYYEGLAYAKETNLPILLDFTGHGCVNCRKTEEHIWIEDKVWNRLAEDYVLISLYVDDRKKLEEELISKSRNTKLRNIGNKWADFQIVNFQQNSQPLYVMMSPDEKVLAAPRGYKEGVDDYAEFLECGLKTYEDKNKGLIGQN